MTVSSPLSFLLHPYFLHLVLLLTYRHCTIYTLPHHTRTAPAPLSFFLPLFLWAIVSRGAGAVLRGRERRGWRREDGNDSFVGQAFAKRWRTKVNKRKTNVRIQAKKRKWELRSERKGVTGGKERATAAARGKSIVVCIGSFNRSSGKPKPARQVLEGWI